jgi:tetratricopeptide (TPR) repeat protein
LLSGEPSPQVFLTPNEDYPKFLKKFHKIFFVYHIIRIKPNWEGKMKKLGIILILIVLLNISLICCKKLTRSPISPPLNNFTQESNTVPPQKSNNPKLDIEFVDLKTKGEQALKDGLLQEAVISLEKAIAIKSDPALHVLLMDAYFKRGMKYYQQNDFENALFDFNKCAGSNQEAKDLIRKIESTKAPITLTPANESTTNYQSINFIWMPNGLADKYQIQIEDESWKTIILKEVKESHLVPTELIPGFLYYWRVRAHYPKEGWGVWSTKKWFRCKE